MVVLLQLNTPPEGLEPSSLIDSSHSGRNQSLLINICQRGEIIVHQTTMKMGTTVSLPNSPKYNQISSPLAWPWAKSLALDWIGVRMRLWLVAVNKMCGNWVRSKYTTPMSLNTIMDKGPDCNVLHTWRFSHYALPASHAPKHVSQYIVSGECSYLPVSLCLSLSITPSLSLSPSLSFRVITQLAQRWISWSKRNLPPCCPMLDWTCQSIQIEGQGLTNV